MDVATRRTSGLGTPLQSGDRAYPDHDLDPSSSLPDPRTRDDTFGSRTLHFIGQSSRTFDTGSDPGLRSQTYSPGPEKEKEVLGSRPVLSGPVLLRPHNKPPFPPRPSQIRRSVTKIVDAYKFNVYLPFMFTHCWSQTTVIGTKSDTLESPHSVGETRTLPVPVNPR